MPITQSENQAPWLDFKETATEDEPPWKSFSKAETSPWEDFANDAEPSRPTFATLQDDIDSGRVSLLERSKQIESIATVGGEDGKDPLLKITPEMFATPQDKAFINQTMDNGGEFGLWNKPQLPQPVTDPIQESIRDLPTPYVQKQAGDNLVAAKRNEEDFLGSIALTPLIDYLPENIRREFEFPTERNGRPINSAAGGVLQGLSGIAKSFTSPLGLATLNMSALSKPVQRAVSLAFSADMASKTPELARQLGEEMGKNEKDKNPTRIAQLITEGAANTIFATLAGKHGLSPSAKPVSAMTPFEKADFVRNNIAKVVQKNAEIITPKQQAINEVETALVKPNAEILPDATAALSDKTSAPVIPEPVAPQTAPAVAPKPLPEGDKLVTVQRADGTTYEASYGGKNWQHPTRGEVPSIAVLNGKGEWSHGMLKPGEKIVEPTISEVSKPIELIDETVSEASVQAASKVEDFIPSEKAMGITPSSKSIPIDDTITTPAKESLTSSDPKVEQRWKDARRSEKSLYQKFKDAAVAVKNEFFRADPALDPKTDGVFIDAARRFRTVSRHSQEMAANVLRGFTAGFGKNKLEVYQRNVILRDLAKDVEGGKYDGRDIPFGYTPETLALDVAKFSELSKLNPSVSDAITRRDAFMETLKKELVDSGALPEKVLEDGDYFHRQVIQYLDMKEAFTSGTSSSDVRTHKKGFQKERTFSSKDYNTNYLESEYEVIAQSLAILRTQKAIAEFKKQGDIKPQLQAQAKAINAANPDGKQITWEDLIPEDHTIWQPKEGHAFYKAMTIPDKIIDDVLSGGKVLSKEDLKEVLAMGGAREQWVIPKRLSQTLDNINPQVDSGAISKVAHKATNAWKVWILLNPIRSIKYGLNNLSGDADIAFAYSPKILSSYASKAAGDMRRYVLKRGAVTKEISDGIENGVLSSGFSVAEVPDINSHQFFRVMTGENVSFIERAWQKNKDYHNWRENTLRLASWRLFKDKLAGAKEGERFYGASRKAEVDALYDAKAPKEIIAAKLARELIGDYGNISHAGQWIRSHAIPFYSWLEINAPRYGRLLRNAAAEGEGRVAGRVAKVAATKIATKTAVTAALASGMYVAVNLWNHTMFPKEEAELGEGRRQLHLILGRNEDGTVRTLRIQGALSDALSWFGGEDFPSDISDVATGKETIGDKAVDAVQAPAKKIISGVTPFIKTPAEALTRRSLFPDPFNPRPIRDPLENLTAMFSLDKVYRYLSDKPMRPLANEISDLVFYSTDPGEASYHMTRGMVASWKEKQGDESPSIIPTQRQNALFYYKKSLSYGDPEKAARWKQRYLDLGGKKEGIEQSVRMSSPSGSLNAKDKREFLKTLSPKEREIFDRAETWYKKIYK